MQTIAVVVRIPRYQHRWSNHHNDDTNDLKHECDGPLHAELIQRQSDRTRNQSQDYRSKERTKVIWNHNAAGTATNLHDEWELAWNQITKFKLPSDDINPNLF